MIFSFPLFKKGNKKTAPHVFYCTAPSPTCPDSGLKNILLFKLFGPLFGPVYN